MWQGAGSHRISRHKSAPVVDAIRNAHKMSTESAQVGKLLAACHKTSRWLPRPGDGPCAYDTRLVPAYVEHTGLCRSQPAQTEAFGAPPAIARERCKQSRDAVYRRRRLSRRQPRLRNPLTRPGLFSRICRQSSQVSSGKPKAVVEAIHRCSQRRSAASWSAYG